jgi:hypothetical protein
MRRRWAGEEKKHHATMQEQTDLSSTFALCLISSSCSSSP